MGQINIKVGDIIETINIGNCKVLKIQADGVIAETELGAEYVPCSEIIGVLVCS